MPNHYIFLICYKPLKKQRFFFRCQFNECFSKMKKSRCLYRLVAARKLEYLTS
jgi:hypothetical protein